MASSSTVRSSDTNEPVESTGAREAGYSEHYPYPSHVNAASFVSIKLSSEDNYDVWQEQMMCLVKCHGMLGFINGTFVSPMEGGEAREEWERADMLVKGWIFGSLTEDAMETVVGLDTAYHVWEKLKPINYTPPVAPTTSITTEKDPAEYLPLHRAIVTNDWETAKAILKDDKDAFTAIIAADTRERAIHLALGKDERLDFLEYLLERINPDLLPTLLSIDKLTPLHLAADSGNKMAAEMLVYKNPYLLFILDKNDLLPIHRAVINSHRTTSQYLLDACQQHIELSQQHGYPNPFEDTNGAMLLTFAIGSGFLDISNYLIIKYPNMATTNCNPLIEIAAMRDSYYSGTRYSYYQKFVYSCLPIDNNLLCDTNNIQDIENQNTRNANLTTKGCLYSVVQRINVKFWNVVVTCVLHIKHLREEKVKHRQTLSLLRRICEEVEKVERLKYSDNQDDYNSALELAVYNDTFEVVEEIIKCFPSALWAHIKGGNLTKVAIKERSEKVYNLLVRYMSYEKPGQIQGQDPYGNNILHLAGRLAPTHKLNLVSGAALQMQRELQWFLEVQHSMKPMYMGTKHTAEDAPMMVFRKEHKQLRKEGEEWVKKAADSYTITAALIITIVFAAAITVPGGNDGNSGKPIYTTKPSFIVFAVSDAISLFTSTTSLLLFLSILTTRFRDEDFLYSLPKRLILGLVMLFLSVTSMMVAFSATLYLMFGQGKSWILIPIATLTCLPIASFVTLQLPLLVDMISSTYGHGIFAKQSDNKEKIYNNIGRRI